MGIVVIKAKNNKSVDSHFKADSRKVAAKMPRVANKKHRQPAYSLKSRAMFSDKED